VRWRNPDGWKRVKSIHFASDAAGFGRFQRYLDRHSPDPRDFLILQARDVQPALRDVDILRVGNELQAGMQTIEQTLESTSSLNERLPPKLLSGQLKQVEHKQDCGALVDCTRDEFLCKREAMMKGAKIRDAMFVRDDDLAIEERRVARPQLPISVRGTRAPGHDHCD